MIGFIVNSGTQSHNLQDIKAFELEQPETSTTGYIASPPAGAIGSPRTITGGGRNRHNIEHVGSFKATTEDRQSIVIQNMANAQGFENNTISASLLSRRGVSAELGANPCLRKGGTTITASEMYVLYYVDPTHAEANTIATIYTNTHDGQDTSRSCDSDELNIQHIAANTIGTYMLEYMAKTAVRRTHTPHL